MSNIFPTTLFCKPLPSQQNIQVGTLHHIDFNILITHQYDTSTFTDSQGFCISWISLNTAINHSISHMSSKSTNSFPQQLKRRNLNLLSCFKTSFFFSQLWLYCPWIVKLVQIWKVYGQSKSSWVFCSLHYSEPLNLVFKQVKFLKISYI